MVIILLTKLQLELCEKNKKTFYFNAWEYDYLGDALSAMLLRLIADDDGGLTQESIEKAISMINMSAGLKNVTHGFIDINKKTRKADLVKLVKDQVNRHNAVNEFIDKLKGDSERLVFVIDELDRCRPSFAVELLEVIKHYFMHDDVTFIITTNINQLSHTIKKYYGSSFDEYAYLNKFFDFIFGLRKVGIEEYARVALDWDVQYGIVADRVACDAIKYYGFEMREINSYHSSLLIVIRFLARDNNWDESQYPVQLIFVPLALALRIKDGALYKQFISGHGEDILRSFATNTRSAFNYVNRIISNRQGLSQEQTKEGAMEALVGEYKNLFIPGDEVQSNRKLQDFYEAISLIGSYTTIPVESNK